MPAMRFSDVPRFLAVLLALAATAHADDETPSQDVIQQPLMQPPPGTGSLTIEPRAVRLDALFARLKRESDPEAAKAIAGEIRAALTESDSATVDLLMTRASNAIASNQTAAAFDYLDQVTVLRPDYAEGWNLRATLHFALGNNRKSVADIRRTLALEPRHLGALSGLAGILTLDGRDEAALKVWEAYLALYPADRTAQDQARDLLEKMAGSRT
ncbi:hypothetical protein [Gellertiella hungarica]|uniref:Tetratricopeptide (TPR) repeat protein n=1 Tax=Gellertiella hungarica TaxID=1572859 RepID=A0A7W6J2X4_9HYPH|nr:hypothetical protein [Gellertiella hungarica]MBB4063122.1 tetratricopeptide (TPR) repeat protein [Gellertiella hungarica]